MKAISLKAQSTASLRIAEIAGSMATTVSNHRTGLAMIFGTASFIGTLLSADTLAYAGAFLTLVAVYPIKEKGGKR